MVSLWGLWIRRKMALPMRLKQIIAASTATVHLSNWSCFTKYFLNIASVSISLKTVVGAVSVEAADWRRPQGRELKGRGQRFQACRMRRQERHRTPALSPLRTCGHTIGSPSLGLPDPLKILLAPPLLTCNARRITKLRPNVSHVWLQLACWQR